MITSKREDLDRLKNTIKNSLEQITFYDFQHTFDIAEVFLKVVLNTITLTPIITCILLMNYFLIFPCRQLLNDCGIGVSSFSGNQAAMSEGPVVGQHRVLLFCQLKSMLEIVESDLLK
jgi:SNF2 family DNA or RNA helicase